eukprot:TRINITY_DN2276_c0_g1_i1.p1 TRINITY_DN2276_c0_g1~~TRINITY_DN2276_c0_g1_i1.p1  ORF type:complete len:424 (-),score=106.49 TRINITY_DN2276_c0_g1_i1:85-1356(-)
MAFPSLSGTSLFGGGTNPGFGTTSTNLFSGTTAQPTTSFASTAFSSLGSTQPTTAASPFGGTSLFRPPAMQSTSTLPTFGGLIQHGNTAPFAGPAAANPQGILAPSTTFVAPGPALRPGEYSLNTGGSRQSEHDYQLLQILSNFALMSDERNPDYPFKCVLYNRVKDEQKHLCKQFQSYQYWQPNSKAVLIHVPEAEWNESIARNPMPELLYPYQITSWEELNGRLSEYKKTQDLFWKLLDESQAKLNKLKELYTSQIGKIIEERKETNRMLFNKLIMLYGALEKIATRHNRINKDVPGEMSLGNRLQQIEKSIEAPELRSVLNDLRSKAQELAIAREGKKGGEVMKEISKANAATILHILNEQRKGIEGVMKIHLQNKHDIEVLTKGLKELAPNAPIRRDNGVSAPVIDYSFPVTIKPYPGS